MITLCAPPLLAAAQEIRLEHPDPLQKTTEPKADQPVTVDDRPNPTAIADAEIGDLVALLTGSFASAPASKGATEIRFSSAPVSIVGLDNALYFEVARADSAWSPFRQGVMHLYRHAGAEGGGNELRLRLFDLTGQPGLREAVVGLWAAPEAFPPLKLEQLIPTLELVMTPGSGRPWFGRTPHPYPTVRAGAVELTSEIMLTHGSLSISDRGLDASGHEAWQQSVVLAATPPSVRAERREGGLTIVTLTPPTDPASARLEDKGLAAVHFAEWVPDGTKIDDSRGRGPNGTDGAPIQIRLPLPGLPGLNDAMLGMGAGERRRVVIPPALAYGEQGAPRMRIPASATIIFEIECLMVDNAEATAPPAPPMGPGHPGHP